MEVVKMTDKELRKEKDDLLDCLFEKISKVKSNTDLKEILTGRCIVHNRAAHHLQKKHVRLGHQCRQTLFQCR